MTDQFERRDFIQGVGLVAGVAAAASLAEQPAVAQTAPLTGPKLVYQPKPMSFDPKAIKGISEKILVSHYENNYIGAVRRLTALAAQIADLDYAKAPNFVVNGLKREELVATNSMILHEVYFDSLGGGSLPNGSLSDAIKHDFGSIEACGRPSDPRFGYVRARLSYGLRRRGGALRRRLHGGDPLGRRREELRPLRPRELSGRSRGASAPRCGARALAAVR